jgi:N-acetylmuramic acid 6-phosphate etherase
MILLGKVYRGLMVDVRAVNEKLVKRGEDILIQLTERNRDDARDALSRANGNIKVAILLLNGCDLDPAKRLLSKTNGRLGAALRHLAAAQATKA